MRQRCGNRNTDFLREFPFGHLDPCHGLPYALSLQHALWSSGGSACVDNCAEVLCANDWWREWLWAEAIGFRHVVDANAIWAEAKELNVWILLL